MCLLPATPGFRYDDLMGTATVSDLDAYADSYVNLWNGGDQAARRATICTLWGESGTHTSPRISVRGYDELEARVARSYQRWIVEEGCRFRRRDKLTAHHNVLRITWDMIDREGLVQSVGTEILIFDDRGKIDSVYQFIEE
jgi:hypothetical protein